MKPLERGNHTGHTQQGRPDQSSDDSSHEDDLERNGDWQQVGECGGQRRPDQSQSGEDSLEDTLPGELQNRFQNCFSALLSGTPPVQQKRQIVERDKQDGSCIHCRFPAERTDRLKPRSHTHRRLEIENGE